MHNKYADRDPFLHRILSIIFHKLRIKVTNLVGQVDVDVYEHYDTTDSVRPTYFDTPWLNDSLLGWDKRIVCSWETRINLAWLFIKVFDIGKIVVQVHT